MVKSIFPILIILIVLCSCSKKENNAENKSLDSTDKGQIISYKNEDGKSIVTAVVEIIDSKAKIVNYKYIDNVLYIIYM